MHTIINTIKKSAATLIIIVISKTAFAQTLNDNDIKKNINSISSPLQKLVLLEPKTFQYNTERFKHLKLQPGKQYGFLAEDMQSIFPELVKEKTVSYMFGKNVYRNTTIKTIDEAGLVPLLVASIKEQQQEIEKLKAAIEILEQQKTVAVNE